MSINGTFSDLLERVRAFVFRSREEGELDEELRFHVEMQTEAFVREGLEPKEARRRALIKLGGVEQTKERVREARGTRWLDAFAKDLHYGARTMRRSPGFAAVVVLTLAIGIGANTTVFSVVNPYLLRELPYGDADRLAQLGQVDPVTGWDAARLSLPQYVDWKERSRAFEDMAAYHYGPQSLTGDGPPERVMTGVVTGNMFSLLGAPPLLGRALTAADDGPAGDDVVVLSHGLWTRRYGADPGIVGRTIRLDGAAHRVVGVMPADFTFPWNEVRLWIPMRADPAREPRDATGDLVVGRLSAGWSREQAREELEGIQAELAAQHPDADGRFAGVSVRPLREALNFQYDVVRTGLIVLLSAVAAVLLIACVNVASLTLARASVRRREIAVRMAIGAGRSRVARQLLAENLLLALTGGALGLGMSYGAIGLIGAKLPEDLYRVGTATLDTRVLLFSLGPTLATPLIFGLAPAFAAARTALSQVLRDGGRAAGAGARTLRGRRALVVTQVALAVVLIVGAGLMIRSFRAVQHVDLGFRADRLLTAEITLPQGDYATPESRAGYFERATREAGALPGVRAAGMVAPLPLNHENWTVQFSSADVGDAAQEDWPLALDGRASPGYFDAAGIPVVAGRGFGAADGPGTAPVIVVNRRLAERVWPGESPVGRTLSLAAGDGPIVATVVGVVGDVRHTGLTGEIAPKIYRPLAQAPVRRRFLIVSAAAGEPQALADPVRRTLAAVDPELPVTVRPMSAIVGENDFQWRISSMALAAFGLLALLLAALGLYGIVTYTATQRRREIGIRIALGADAGEVLGLVVRDGLRLALLGLGIGIVAALAAGRLLASQLFGVSPFDPITVVGVVVLFVAVAAAASLRPAMRAAARPPQDVLRAD